MFYLAEPDEISEWFLVFHTKRSPTWWLRLVNPGRFTHVTAFAYAKGTQTWIFIDPTMFSTRVFVAPDGSQAERLLAQVSVDAAIIKMRVLPGERFRLRLLFSCVSAARHLLNLPGGYGALSVDRLWRDCLAHGAEIVTHEHPAAAA